MIGVGTAVSSTSFSQLELLDTLEIADPRVRSVFLNSAIERRHLTLPPLTDEGIRIPEPQGDLLDKHKVLALEMGAAAVEACLKRAGAELSDIAHLCCVTSTGFLTPGLSAHLIKAMGIDRHCSRTDIVGMGCNAGLNALNVVAGWAGAHPGELAVVVCAEACSAAYTLDGTMRTAVVNSLFGDGAAAVALVADDGLGRTDSLGQTDSLDGPRLLTFASCLIPEAVDAMRYDWDRTQDRFSFYLDPQIPYVVGAHAELVVDRLLSGTGLRRSDINHWLVHSGGKKVIDAAVVNLGLSRYDVRHTIGVLRDYGNVSSGSFLFSYERLLEEGITQPGEYGVLMTMGPGSTIETALVQWCSGEPGRIGAGRRRGRAHRRGDHGADRRKPSRCRWPRMSAAQEQFDVVVVGGPGDSTVATFVAMQGHRFWYWRKRSFRGIRSVNRPCPQPCTESAG